MFVEDSKELAQHKLILLYIINKIDFQATNSEITQFVLENNVMNYFYVQQYLSELINTKFIEIDNDDDKEYYELTKLGEDTLKYFDYKIPNEIKESIDIKYEERLEQKKKETQILADYFKKNDLEFIVTLKVIENEITLFNLTLNVPSIKQAKVICNNWKDNPQDIYKKIFDLVISKDK